MAYSLYSKRKLGHQAPCKEMTTALYYPESVKIIQTHAEDFLRILEGWGLRTCSHCCLSFRSHFKSVMWRILFKHLNVWSRIFCCARAKNAYFTSQSYWENCNWRFCPHNWFLTNWVIGNVCMHVILYPLCTEIDLQSFCSGMTICRHTYRLRYLLP